MLVNKKLNERVYVCTTVEDAAGVCVMRVTYRRSVEALRMTVSAILAANILLCEMLVDVNILVSYPYLFLFRDHLTFVCRAPRSCR